MRFTNPVHADDWFYTFNSADIMFRRYAPITNTSVGHNNYPIPGGLLISTQDTFLHIFPTFPLGAGLPNSEQFELHLHRNPQNDDHFGIGEPLYETYSVEHELLIGLTDMNTGPIWKKYIDYKTTPLVTFLSKEKILTEDLEKAFVMKKDWEFSTEYSLLQETTCAYISSIVERNNELVCRIVNICDELISEKINSLDMIREINAIGGELMERNYASPGGVIEGVVNNSGANFVSYPDVSAVGMISPFDLKTYRMKKNFKYSGTNPLFAFGLFENNHNHHDYTLIYVAFAVVGTISMAIVGLVLAKYCRGNTKLRSEPLI